MMACLHREGKLALGSTFVHESVIGTQFVGELIGETMVSGHPTDCDLRYVVVLDSATSMSLEQQSIVVLILAC